jgi:hypothetical protein
VPAELSAGLETGLKEPAWPIRFAIALARTRDSMSDIARRDFTTSLFALLKETFEGPGGNAYLDQGAGLFQTLDALTAKEASHVPCVGAQTIAAHCAHLAYYVRANHDSMMGREPRLDWSSSWRPQQVGDQEWEELKDRVRREYAALLETLDSLETWSDQQVGDSMAIVAHTAYHLGAIRHALKNLRLLPGT